jgi:arginine N-succinyltransferase
MMIVRPIAATDVDALFVLASKAGVGLTSLPAERAWLQRRVDASLASFAGAQHRADEMFVFVLEDTARQRVVGTCAIATAVGLRQPWYSYRVGQVVHASQALGVFTQMPTLFLSNDHTGHSELCSLLLDPEYRHSKNGSLLSKSRFLFLAQYRARFSDKIIAELRGVSDADGRSPFWESLGRHFFSMEFSRADYLTGIGKKSFVAELMPKHPLYSGFLTPEAQAVIGKTHELTAPARAMLEAEGFRFEGHVDIFDAGPAVECDVDDIDAVAASRVYTVRVADREVSDADISYLVARVPADGELSEFRVAAVHARVQGETIALIPEDARVVGATVRAVPLSVRDRLPPASNRSREFLR